MNLKKYLESRQYETVKFVFLKAVHDLFEGCTAEIQNSLNNGSYAEIYHVEKREIKILSEEEINNLREKMKEIIEENIPIKLVTDDVDELKRKAATMKRKDIKHILENCGWARLKEYSIGDYVDYFYLNPESSTGKILDFEIYKYNRGIIFKTPLEVLDWKIAPYKNTPKIAKAFHERDRWEKVMGINYVGSINEKVFENKIIEQIMLNETFHDRKIADMASEILANKKIRIVTIAGPSSSGKTTLSKKMELQLKTGGAETLAISLDNYYIGRANVPLDENGEKDFETIEALDLELLNKNLEELIRGEETELPLYDFFTGERKSEVQKAKLSKDGIIIIEGIHGLNDRLTSHIPRENKYKIYISCLTQTNMDMHNRIHTTDVRKIRRIVRDSLSRETTGEETLMMWNSIRRGEEKWIFPFQEEADAIFNSSFTYELGVLKPYALKELIKVKVTSEQYDEAKKLANLLSCFVDIDPSFIPVDSIMKEFIGGSVFYNY